MSSIPLAVLSPNSALEIPALGDESVVRIPVPGVDRDDIRLDRLGDDLVVTLGVFLRTCGCPTCSAPRTWSRARDCMTATWRSCFGARVD